MPVINLVHIAENDPFNPARIGHFRFRLLKTHFKSLHHREFPTHGYGRRASILELDKVTRQAA